ncbi:hypothetical protein B0H14DRAFT_2602183 [Mycena olivaceomarginata]|nr:hypothetical protein B0H14DRAFT_2602183 [Mycena olivaceomarginata]
MSPPQMTRSEQAEKRRQRAAEYRQRPERREKQRVLMAERRYSCLRSGEFQGAPASLGSSKVPKPRKPKVPTTRPPTPSPNSAHETESPNSGDNESESKSNTSFTSAEHFALGVLAELKYAEDPTPAQALDTTTGLKVGGIYPDSHPTDGDIQMRYSSPSHASSMAAVHEEPVQPPNEQPRWITRRHTPLPGYVMPETSLQKKMRRELGTVSPLTPIQVVQIKAFKLRRLSKYHEEEEPATPRPGPFLSTARWESICWDAPVRQEFAEEALRRWTLSQMGQSSKQ